MSVNLLRFEEKETICSMTEKVNREVRNQLTEVWKLATEAKTHAAAAAKLAGRVATRCGEHDRPEHNVLSFWLESSTSSASKTFPIVPESHFGG